MNVKRVIKLVLNLPAETILPTIKAYTTSFNHIVKCGFQEQNFDKVYLHNKTYTYSKTLLPSQLSVSSREKAVECLKSNKSNYKRRLKIYECKKTKYAKNNNLNKLQYLKKPKYSCPESKQTSIRYDSRSYNMWLNKNELSLSTISGRIKCSFIVPEYFKQYTSWKRETADLFVRNNKVFLHVVFSKDIEDTQLTSTVDNIYGLDVGVNNIAVLSGQKLVKFFSGSRTKEKINAYRVLRQNLQQHNTKSSRRHLRKLRSRERLFRRDINHCISKEITEILPTGSVLVLEKLKDIRDTLETHDKDHRRMLNSWGFAQLQELIEYKCSLRNIIIVYVNPKNTSIKCLKCNCVNKDNRKIQSWFECFKCGYSLNADLVGSRNIRNKYLGYIIDLDKVPVSVPVVH